MTPNAVLCQGTNLDGTPCTRHREIFKFTCRWHHPEVLEARARKLEQQAALLRSTSVVTA